MSGRHARGAAEAAFPDRTIVDVRPQDGWVSNETAAIEFEDGDLVYVKVATTGNDEQIARSAASSRFAAERTGVAVGGVLATGTLDGGDELPYLVTAPHPGEPMEDAWIDADPDRRRSLVRELGRTVAALHEPRFERHGRIVGGDETGLDLDSGPWPNVLDELLGGMEPLLPERFPDAVSVVREALRTRRDLLATAPAGLVHRDHRENLFRDPWGFIDWDNAVIGDPGLDLARSEADFIDRPDVEDPWSLRDELYAGYRAKAGSLPDGFAERRPLYRAVTFLTTVVSFEMWAPDGPKTVEEHAEWVGQEVRRRARYAGR